MGYSEFSARQLQADLGAPIANRELERAFLLCAMSPRVAPATPPAGGAPLATEESFKLPSRPPATAAPVVVCLYKATDCATDLYGRFQGSPLWQVQVVHEASDGPIMFIGVRSQRRHERLH